MKTINKKRLLMFGVLILSSLNSYAQAPLIIADTIRNNCSETVNNILIQLCDSSIIKINNEGKVKVTTDLTVPNGYIATDSIHARIITADSIRFNGAAIFDSVRIVHDSIVANSIHVQILEVGDSSLVGGSLSFRFADVFGTDMINRSLSFGRIIKTGPGGIISDLDGNFRGVNIGTTTSTYKFHIHDDGTRSGANAYTHFTNTATGQTANDGFQIGIAGDKTAQLNQRENLPLNFYTAGSQRMTILGDGKVGINTTAPDGNLHIIGNTVIENGLANTGIRPYSLNVYAGTPAAIDDALGGIYINSTGNTTPLSRVSFQPALASFLPNS